MDENTFRRFQSIGENVTIAFRTCGNGIELDTYETVCSFLNRFGGDLFLGVRNDGTVIGVPEAAANDMIRNFISVIGNSDQFNPTVYLAPEPFWFEGHLVIHVHVPPSSEVHSWKNTVYDRVGDTDVKVASTSGLSDMYLRKRDVFTEKRIYPSATLADFRLDLLPRIRQAAANHAAMEHPGRKHPWMDMDDMTLMKSAGLYEKDFTSGKAGFNLAAILLLGKDETIRSVCPAYETDALVYRMDMDRYDERLTVRTNLVESYDLLMDFMRRNLQNKFFLEGDVRVNLREIIAREIVSNILMHREFASSIPAKLVITRDKVYSENANRAQKCGFITPDNVLPDPKNPTIAAFFRTIARADSLGSGVRNLFKYSKFYSGRDPELIEDDVFRTTVPLDESYSFDYLIGQGIVKTGDTYKRLNVVCSEPSREAKGSPYREIDHAGSTGQDEANKVQNGDIAGAILDYCAVPRSKQEIMEHYGYKNKTWFTRTHLDPLLQSGQLAMTVPGNRRDRNQRYIAVSRP